MNTIKIANNRIREDVIIVPYGVEYIGRYEFAGSNASTIILPSTVKIIDHCAFAHSAIESMIIPSDIQYIGENAFSNCNGLKSVKFNDDYIENNRKSITIDNYAFSGCRKLKSIDISSDVHIHKLGVNIFEDCTYLTTENGKYYMITDNKNESLSSHYLVNLIKSFKNEYRIYDNIFSLLNDRRNADALKFILNGSGNIYEVSPLILMKQSRFSYTCKLFKMNRKINYKGILRLMNK